MTDKSDWFYPFLVSQLALWLSIGFWMWGEGVCRDEKLALETFYGEQENQLPNGVAAGASITTLWWLDNLGSDEDEAVKVAICVSDSVKSAMKQLQSRKNDILYGDISDVYANILHFCSKNQ